MPPSGPRENSHATPRHLRVFVSSPSDVAEERALALRVLSRLGSAWRQTFLLDVILWEQEPLTADRGFQEQIFAPSQCDLVVAILWSRLGTKLPPQFATDAQRPPPTGTEFEIRDALASSKQQGKPDVLLYRRMSAAHVDVRSESGRERIAQYEALDNFCRELLTDAEGYPLAHHVYQQPWEFEASLQEQVSRWLDAAAGKERRSLGRWIGGSPYRGLGVFDAEHSALFFGRAQACSELVHMLQAEERKAVAATRFLLVQGTSGVGKSSLLRAGLLPMLEGRAIEGVAAWRNFIVQPASVDGAKDPDRVFLALARGLADALVGIEENHGVEALAELMRQRPEELGARLDGYLGATASLLGCDARSFRLTVCVDSLDECWTLLGAPWRSQFSRCLQQLAAEGRVWVVATLRVDFFSEVFEHPEYLKLLQNGKSYTLLPPRPDELRAMIVEPALAAGLRWESRNGVSLDEIVLREAIVSPEALPMMEFALDNLYRDRRAETLVYEAYPTGGLPASIAASAEACVEKVGVADVLLERLFRSWVRVTPVGGVTRRHAAPAEWSDEPECLRLVDALLNERLCARDRTGIALAHEALLVAWPRLQAWLVNERSLLRLRELFVIEANEWQQRGRPSALLASGPEKMADIHRMVTSRVPLDPVVHTYAHQSIQREKKKASVRVATLSGLLLLAISTTVASLLFLQQRDAAQQAQAKALAGEGVRALAAGDIEQAKQLANAAEVAWRGPDGQSDPEASALRLRAMLVLPAPNKATAHGALLNWSFPSHSPRSESDLYLISQYGDIVVVNPKDGQSRRIAHVLGEVVTAAKGADGSVGLVDARGAVAVAAAGAEKAEHIGNPFAFSGPWTIACDQGRCLALGWSRVNSRCEAVDLQIADRRARTLALWSGGAPTEPSKAADQWSPARCTWRGLEPVSGGRWVALDASGNAFMLTVDATDAVAVTPLSSGVDKLVPIGSGRYGLVRGREIEVRGTTAGEAQRLLSGLADVERVTVTTARSPLAVTASDGAVEVWSDARSIRLSSSSEIPIRVFGLRTTAAVLAVGAEGTVRLLEAQTTEELFRWKGSPSPLRAAFYSAAENRLSLLDSDGALHIWDVAGLEAVATVGAPAFGSVVNASARTLSLTPKDTQQVGVPVSRLLASDVESGFALLALKDGVEILHRGRSYRIAGLGSVSEAQRDGDAWLLSDGALVVRVMRPPTTSASPMEPEVVWRSNGRTASVSKVLSLRGGRLALVAGSDLIVVQSGGVELTSVSLQPAMVEANSQDWVRSQEVGSVVVLESAACQQLHIHAASGRLLLKVRRLCDPAELPAPSRPAGAGK